MSFTHHPRLSVAVVAGTACIAAVCAVVIHRSSSAELSSRRPDAPRILYFQDPMHPAYRSNQPGKAPDCGMDLVPVYASPVQVSFPAEPAVSVGPTAARLIGLDTFTVQRSADATGFQTTGKVVVDESRVYRVTALAEGVVRSVAPLAVGSPVQKDQRLATYFVPARDLYNAIQAFVLASGTYDATSAAGRDTAVLKSSKAQARVEQELLESYGVSSQQIRDLARSHEVTRDIDLRSPATGVILDREVSAGQAVPRGTEVFRVADLRSVWVLADVYEADAERVQPGQIVTVTYADKSYPARVDAGRQFDPATRTLKIRLEVSNPGLVLRPDMFVSVGFTGNRKSRVLVPSDAVLDTGARKVVFVATGPGSYAPREVTAGDEQNGAIEVRSGVREGDEIVAHGSFFLDSETRLQANAAHPASSPSPISAANDRGEVGSPVLDPECGMPVAHPDPALSELSGGKKVYFCSPACKRKFDAKHHARSTSGEASL